MRKAAILSFFVSFLITAPAMADMVDSDSKVWLWGWPIAHERNHNFVPYLEEAKTPHNSQWNGDQWEPEHWFQNSESEMELIRSFYSADIFRNQYTEDEIPVLKVGPNFYNLSGFDRRRVTRVIDEVYNITTDHEHGIFILVDWDSEKQIGTYTRYGLHLQ